MDEWSSLPWDLQPYLAEFVKRAFFGNSRVTVKIASLVQRSNFTKHDPHGPIGFELGSDISASLDLDEYYIFEKSPDYVVGIFADILFKHINNQLPEHYLAGRYGINGGIELARFLCRDISAFNELIRASEGVARDFINICSAAFFAAFLKKEDRIGWTEVREAARKWFEQDKAANLDEQLRKLFDKMLALLVERRHLYMFCVPVEHERNSHIQRLVDARVVHLVHRGTADWDSPGTRYTLFNFDYGSYVHLYGTSNYPSSGFRRGGDFSGTKQIKKLLLPAEIYVENQSQSATVAEDGKTRRSI